MREEAAREEAVSAWASVLLLGPDRMNSAKADVALSEIFASLASMPVLCRRAIRGTDGISSASLTMVLRAPPGDAERTAEAPWICADLNEAEDAFVRIGWTGVSRSGPVDLMKSEKSRVDSVTIRGSRAVRPLVAVESGFWGVGRLCDRRFMEVEVFVPAVSALPVRVSGAGGGVLLVEIASMSAELSRVIA